MFAEALVPLEDKAVMDVVLLRLSLLGSWWLPTTIDSKKLTPAKGTLYSWGEGLSLSPSLIGPAIRLCRQPLRQSTTV